MNKNLDLSLFGLAFACMICGCAKEDDVVKNRNNDVSITGFIFEKKNNDCLTSDAIVEINESDTLEVIISEIDRVDSLIPTFTGSFTSVRVGGG